MNYRLLKVGYVTLGIITLILCLLSFIFIDELLTQISVNTLIIISACLCFPMFLLKFLHEKKYPPTKTQKMIGWSFVGIMFAYLLFEVIKTF